MFTTSSEWLSGSQWPRWSVGWKGATFDKAPRSSPRRSGRIRSAGLHDSARNEVAAAPPKPRRADVLFRRVSPVIPPIRLGRIPVVAVIRIGINPILLGTVHWYGVFYALAFMVAFSYGALPHVQHYGVTKRQVDRILVWTIIMGLLGARLYYDVQSNFWDPWGGLPTLARRRLRHRSTARRHRCRPHLHTRCHLCRCRADGCLRDRGRRPHVRNPHPTNTLRGGVAAP